MKRFSGKDKLGKKLNAVDLLAVFSERGRRLDREELLKVRGGDGGVVQDTTKCPRMNSKIGN